MIPKTFLNLLFCIEINIFFIKINMAKLEEFCHCISGVLGSRFFRIDSSTPFSVTVQITNLAVTLPLNEL